MFFLIFLASAALVALQVYLEAPFKCNLETCLRAASTYYSRDLANAGSVFTGRGYQLLILTECEDHNVTPIFGNRWFDMSCIVSGKTCIPSLLYVPVEMVLGGFIDTVTFVVSAIWMMLFMTVYAMALFHYLLFSTLTGTH